MIIDKPKTINCHTPHDTTIKEHSMVLEKLNTVKLGDPKLQSTKDKFDNLLADLSRISSEFDLAVSGIELTQGTGDTSKFFSIVSVFQQKMTDIVQVKEVSLRLEQLTKSLGSINSCVELMEKSTKQKALQKNA